MLDVSMFLLVLKSESNCYRTAIFDLQCVNAAERELRITCAEIVKSKYTSEM